MRDWVSYTAGVLIYAGAVLVAPIYWQRANRHPLALDVARLQAAVGERAQWWDATVAPSAPISTNRIAPGLLWDGVYRDGMTAARDLALSVSLTSGGGVCWLDATHAHPTNGAVLVDAPGDWQLVGQSTSYGGTVTNISHTFVPAGATEPGSNPAYRHPASGLVLWPNHPTWSATNAPLASLLRMSVPIIHDGGQGAWWTTIDNGTNLYQYLSEQWPVVRILPLVPGVASAPGTLSIVSAGDVAAVPVSVPVLPAQPRVSVWQSSPPSGAGFQAYWAAYAYDPSATSTNDIIFDPLISHASVVGNLTQPLYVRVRNAPPPGATNWLSAELLWQSPGATFDAWNLRNPLAIHSASSLGPFQLRVAYTGAPAQPYAVCAYRIHYNGNAYDYLASAGWSSAAPAEIAISAARINVTIPGTNTTLRLSLLDDLPSWPPRTNRTLAYHDLDQAWHVVTNLSRTLCVLPASAWAATITQHVGNVSHSSSWAPGAIGGITPGTARDNMIQSLISASAIAATNTAVIGGGWDGRLHLSSGDSGVEWAHDTSAGIVNDRQDTSVDVRYISGSGPLPYPPAAAFAAGKIERISIYAAIVDHPSDLLPMHPRAWLNPDDPSVSSVVWSHAAPAIGHQVSVVLPWVRPPLLPAATNSITIGSTSHYHPGTDAQARLTLLDTIANPTTAPSITIDATGNFFACPHEVLSASWTEFGDLDFARETARTFINAELLHFIIVVDWIWEDHNG